MKRVILAAGHFADDRGDVFVGAVSHRADNMRFDVRSVFPRETTPGSMNKWISARSRRWPNRVGNSSAVTPYIYRNEEHGPELQGPKPVVTQTYPAYFFKRLRVAGQRE